MLKSSNGVDYKCTYSILFLLLWVSVSGLEASAIASNSNVAPDFRRALSLLSTNSWGLNDPGPPLLDQLVHVNQTSVAQSAMHAESHNWALASSDNIHAQQTPSETWGHSLDLHNNGSNMFQEFQLFKASYEPGSFYSNQINWEPSVPLVWKRTKNKGQSPI